MLMSLVKQTKCSEATLYKMHCANDVVLLNDLVTVE